MCMDYSETVEVGAVKYNVMMCFNSWRQSVEIEDADVVD